MLDLCLQRHAALFAMSCILCRTPVSRQKLTCDTLARGTGW